MFLGLLPDWVGDLLTIVAVAVGLPGLLLWVLGRKDANRKLNVEEGTLKKSEFDSIVEAQNGTIEGLRAELREVREENKEALDRLDLMDEVYETMRDGMHRLRGLVRQMVRATNYTMTPEQQHEFDMTKPPPRPPRRRTT